MFQRFSEIPNDFPKNSEMFQRCFRDLQRFSRDFQRFVRDFSEISQSLFPVIFRDRLIPLGISKQVANSGNGKDQSKDASDSGPEYKKCFFLRGFC